ncbi:MAG TPA: DUF5752 family protein [Dehalococcoidia bacterium]|nr:DUF5752 family protein [Dehalococcoidia bacterium]
MAKFGKVSKEEAKRYLGDVPNDKRFWCHDGKTIKNLRELRKALIDMSDETFHYHLGEGRNDFSKWIREVVGDDKLAEALNKTKSRMQASQTVAERLSFLERKV